MRHFRKSLPVLALLGAATWPITDLAVANTFPLDGYSVAIWLIGLIVLTSAVTFLLYKLTQDFGVSAAVIAPLTLMFFSFPLAEPAIRRVLSFVGARHGAATTFLFLMLLAAWILWRAARSPDTKLVLQIAPAIIGGFSLLLCLGLAILRTPNEVDQHDPTWKFAQKPNVYHFLFDALGRPDALERRLGLVLPEMSQALGERGFVQARDARAAKLFTIDSINSMLSPTALADGLTDLDASGSLVVRQFRRSGYSFVRYGEVFKFSGCTGDEDLCLSSQRRGLTETDVALLRRTPLFSIWRRKILGSTDSRSFFLNLRRVSSAQPKAPFYLFSYMVPPHPPFIFDKDCRTNQQGYADFRAWRKEGREQYGQSYKCVARALQPAVDEIVARDPSAIIIVSGDHGTAFLREGNGKKRPMPKTIASLDERQSVFLAVRGPPSCSESFSSITRLDQLYPRVFGCLSGPTVPRSRG